MTPPLLNITLSHEELGLLLRLLNLAPIPGLRPTFAATPEQEAFGLAVAARALRARELAQLDADGQFVLHTAVAALIGVVALPERAVVVQHIRTDVTVRDMYAARRGAAVVSYTTPEVGLYQFSALPDLATLIERVLAFCDGDDLPVPPAMPAFVIDDAALRAVRSSADAGDADAAEHGLLQAHAPPASAAALAAALTTPHRLSIIFEITPQGDAAPVVNEITLLGGAAGAWLMLPGATEGSRQLQPITTDALHTLLAERLG